MPGQEVNRCTAKSPLLFISNPMCIDKKQRKVSLSYIVCSLKYSCVMLSYSKTESVVHRHKVWQCNICTVYVYVLEREGSFYDLCSNCSLITDSDVRSELLYYTTGTGICDLHLHFHSMWHWQSFLHHPLPTPPVCVRESVCVCVRTCVYPQSVLQSCLPRGSLSLSVK